jgi:thioredoxin-like negative regulator of GroEL
MREYIFFKMPNCSPCTQLKPIMEQFTNVKSVDASEDFEKALEYNIRKAPTVVILEGGIEVGRFHGFKTKQEIETYLDSLQIKPLN